MGLSAANADQSQRCFAADVTGDIVLEAPGRVAPLTVDDLRKVVQSVERSRDCVRDGVIKEIRGNGIAHC
jgi:hypothetical protein